MLKDHSLSLSSILVKGKIPGHGEPYEFLNAYYKSEEMQKDPYLKKIHQTLTKNASVCSFCGVGCPYTVTTNKKGVEKLIPISGLGLCVKGSSSLLSGGYQQREKRLEQHNITSDRITSPMIRGHNGKLKEVSWEEALERAAWLFLHVREWVGPDGIALYGNGQKTMESIWMASLYKLVFNLPTVGANSEHCLSSAGAAHTLNFGNEASFTWREFDELNHADVIILHGTNPIITFPQAYEKAKKNTKAIKVVIDPVKSDTAIDLLETDDRTLHIRFEQGGDVLFNMAVSRYILDCGWEDKTYIEEHVDQQSLEAFKQLCAEDRFTPENVAKQIALEDTDPKALEKTIIYYATLIAKPNANGERPKPAFISSMGINQSTGSYGFSTNLNLLILTGNVGRKGAGSLRIAGQSNATSELTLGFNSGKLVFNLNPEDKTHRQKLAQVLDIPLENIADRKGTPVAKMADNDLLYCFIFIGTQFTKNMPRLGHWKRRLGRSFNIVIDSFMGDGVEEYADVVFPSFTYTERTGVIQRGDRSLQLQQQISKPPKLAWSDEQILARLGMTIAKRLRNPYTAKLNALDPDVIHKTFAKYTDSDKNVLPDKVFDHLVSVSKQLGVYNHLDNINGEAISHQLLKEKAGHGVQWQGNGRYEKNKTQNHFPSLYKKEKKKAKLVAPPEKLFKRLVHKGEANLKSLITGRGRPGLHRKHYIARYNSGIKTLPITGKKDDSYYIELHPEYARKMDISEGEPIRINSTHGSVISLASYNKNVPIEFPFLDFVPGEVNRLTNYQEADPFSNQSMIKRTPIRIEKLSVKEANLWKSPDSKTLSEAIGMLHTRFVQYYPSKEAIKSLLRKEDISDWLSPQLLRNPISAEEKEVASSTAALAAFFQRYQNDKVYKASSKKMLHELGKATKNEFLTIFVPLLRKLDYSTMLLPILSDITGDVHLENADGTIHLANLKEAHDSAVLELKEEVVAVQLFLAIKKGLETLYGEDIVIPRDNIALVSGISIPCAADVPAYYMGISPSDITSSRLIHSRAIGNNSLLIVDRKNNKAVRIDTHTGILPKDKELNKLKSLVIGRKQGATGQEHNRFFDLLEELITQFVHIGSGNFNIHGPVDLNWEEYHEKLSFVPASPSKFKEYLYESNISEKLTHSLIGLRILKPEKDAVLIEKLLDSNDISKTDTNQYDFTEIVNNQQLSTTDKITTVIDAFIEPILNNDGGKIEYLGFDNQTGKVSVEFLGSCANCPCSMLSLETLVVPPLMKIPGVLGVEHRGHLKEGELQKLVSAL